MKVGCGYSTDKSSFVAGAQAAESALAKGNMAHPDLLIGFCSGKLDPAGFFSGMKSTVSSGTPIIGGSAVGVITNDHLSYDGYSSAVAALMLDKIPYQIVTAGDLDRDGRLAGENLAKDISDPFEKNALLIFYDSLKVPATIASPPVMNPSPALIAGIENQLGPDVPILGAGLLSDFDFTIPPRQFGGASVSSNSVVGLLLGRGFTLYSRIMHGCTPLDGVYHRITKGREGVIYEIDNQPAVEMIDAFYGNQAWRQTHPVNLLTIGVNHGKRYEPPNEANYVNRLITGVLPDGSGIGLFEPDLETGTEIQFMLRDSAKMIESARDNVEALMSEIAGDHKNACFGFYIDCAGRSAALSNTLTEEAAEVQKVLNRFDIPLLGFYSGVEIAPCLQKSRGLDWTGVLIIFAE